MSDRNEGCIFQLNCSAGGVPKLPVRASVLTATGLECDRQAHPKFHGGQERAVCLYALELIHRLQSEGHPIYPGSIGENVTTSGLDWAALAPGSRLAIGGEVLIEITSYTVPCKNIAGSFLDRQFKRVDQRLRPGDARLYARVLRTGHVEVGQTIRVLDASGEGGSEASGETRSKVT